MSNIEREPQTGYGTTRSWQCKCGGTIVHRLVHVAVPGAREAGAKLVRQCDACAAQYGADFDSRAMMELGAKPLNAALPARPLSH
jgi:hypothetical protein